MLANVGIPLIGPAIALGWLAIVPVVVVEVAAAVWLLGWRVPFALRWVSLANALTTLLGIPATWFVVAVVQSFTGGSGWGDGSISGVIRSPAWLGPGYLADIGWAVPLGLIVLCVPFFLMSWWVECAFLYSFATERNQGTKAAIRQYAWKANLASYTLLVLLLVAAIAWP